jgi:hypothetical protein
MDVGGQMAKRFVLLNFWGRWEDPDFWGRWEDPGPLSERADSLDLASL